MKPHYKLISIFILIGIIIACIVKCEPDKVVNEFEPTENDSLILANHGLKIENDSIKKIAMVKDTVWMKGAIRWRDAKQQYKADSIPCDSLVLICDTLLMQDSSYIATLKDVIKLDSNIIANYETIVKNDSTEIEKYKKAIIKHMRAKRCLIDFRCRHFTNEVLK